MALVPRIPRRNGDSLLNDTLVHDNSADSDDVNGAGSTGQQQRGQRQTSDSLTPTLRHWENTRSARV